MGARTTRTKRRWNPNVQKVRALVDGTPKRVHVCTGCLKAGRIVDQESVRITKSIRNGEFFSNPVLVEEGNALITYSGETG